MTETINCTQTISIPHGPSYSLSDQLIVAAYDKVSISIQTGTEIIINLQPMPAGKVMFLLIKSDLHDQKITYTCGDKTLPIDRDQVLIGSQVSLLGNIATLKCRNNSAKKANIEVLVGREVVARVEDFKY